MEIAPPRRRTARDDIGLTALDSPVRTCFPRPCKAGRERVAKALFRDRPDLTRTHPGPLRPKCTSENAPVAQLDRAPDYESGGQEFESLRARHSPVDCSFKVAGKRDFHRRHDAGRVLAISYLHLHPVSVRSRLCNRQPKSRSASR
jgi:hypothetical protein